MKKLLLFISILLSCSLHGQMIIKANANAKTIVASSPYGSECISNGTFDSDADWTANYIEGGVYKFADLSTCGLVQAAADMVIVIEASHNYKLEFDISNLAGNANIWIGNSALAVNYHGSGYEGYSNGHQSITLTVPASIGTGGFAIWINVSSDDDFWIDNVSIKEIL